MISPLFEDPGSSPQPENCGSYLYPYATPPQLSQPNVHFSYASLNDVSWIEIFYRHQEDSLHPRGILIGYGNGGQRALGECRIYEDMQKTYKMPTLFCFCNRTSLESPSGLSNANSAYPAIAVGTAAEVHAHDDQDWECFEMAGTLMCWFNAIEGYISVMDGEKSHLSMDNEDVESDDENAVSIKWQTMQCAF